MQLLHRTVLPAALCLLLAVLAPSSAHAEDTRVGIVVSSVINGDTELGERISSALAMSVGETLKAQVRFGPSAEASLPAEAREETCLGDSQCLLNAGRGLGVDQLLMLIIIGLGEEAKVEATWVDVGSGRTTVREAIDVPLQAGLMQRALSEGVQSLLPDIPLREQAVVPPPKEDVNPPKDTSPNQDNTLTTTQPVEASEPSKLPNYLIYGGGAALATSLVLGAVRYNQCDGFDTCESGSGAALEATADIVGVAGILALSVGVYMKLNSDDEAPPVAFQTDGQSALMTYGGSF